MNRNIKINMDQDFRGVEVPLDDAVFVRCRFHFCTLVYSGGGLPRLEGCFMQDCKCEFREAAARTLAFQKILAPAMDGAVEAAASN